MMKAWFLHLIFLPAIYMFERLQQKWKVNGLQLALILCTFALGGSLTGYVGRRLMNLIPIEQNWLWVLAYILIVTLLWPLSVLLVSIPFGQYKFFTSYLKKMGSRFGIGTVDDAKKELKPNKILKGSNTPIAPVSKPRVNLAIFASGAGTNAQKIIEHFRYSQKIKIALIVCNRAGAGILEIARQEHIPALMVEKNAFFEGDSYLRELQEKQIDFIILAGFLWKIPMPIIREFNGRIINIHPALLPKYGGKGMYGRHVHENVLNNKEKESGISIHLVDEIYDNGNIIFQTTCPVLESDTAESLAQRIHKLEHEHYPQVIERWILETSRI